jgi:hypothetical protein
MDRCECSLDNLWLDDLNGKHSYDFINNTVEGKPHVNAMLQMNR